MARTFLRCCLVLALALVALPASASAAEPPWCGTPETDAAENLPDGTDPADPEGSFPHIPYYAVGCTLEDIQDRARENRMRMRVIGQSALGRDMYGVVINRLKTRQEQRDYINWLKVRRVMLDDPSKAQRMLDRFGDDVKVPIYVQGGIHGNEFEGVDAAMDTIEKYATTRYGENPVIDEVLSHAILIFNPIQNPDGRIAGQRPNGNGFDLNRDFLTQSQSETTASISLMKKWLPPEMLDMHGYVEPMLVEATTKPHNPSIEYDLWLKWNQARIDYNQQAMDAIGQDITRPINQWCPESEPNNDGTCDGGVTPGPDVAEGWDDWGPFYGPMYMQHVGLDSSTVEMCAQTAAQRPANAWWRNCGGRAGARAGQNTIQQSTFEFVVANREGMLGDQLEMYERGDEDAPRPECCEPPFDAEFHNWMLDYPQAYVIPFGKGQRSDAEANRLVEWMLFNDIEVERLERDTKFGSQTFEEGSYVVWLAQPRRGLADTALSLGTDISPRIQRLYAPPAAWSHGYLWGADTVTIPDGAKFKARTDRIKRPNRLRGGVESGSAKGYALEVDSPTAVRALNEVLGDGVTAELTTAASSLGPAGTILFDDSAEDELDDVGEDYGIVFARVRNNQTLPAREAVDRSPRIAVLTGAVNQDVWSLRELGFTADPVSTATINSSPTDPLANYDVIYNTASGFPAAGTTGRTRVEAFLAAGGGYVGAQSTGVNFLNGSGNPATGAQVTGLAQANRGGNGRSGIIYWDNTGGAASVITGAYPARDTAIVDPPTWLPSVPSAWSVDGRLPMTGFFAAGLWPIVGDSQSASAPGSAVIAHGTNTAGTARLAIFANNPLYRADPEREWPMLGSALYWADK
jgi:Zinc carboxypeptidase